jgi:hypothetical protein
MTSNTVTAETLSPKGIFTLLNPHAKKSLAGKQKREKEAVLQPRQPSNSS